MTVHSSLSYRNFTLEKAYILAHTWCWLITPNINISDTGPIPNQRTTLQGNTRTDGNAKKGVSNKIMALVFV